MNSILFYHENNIDTVLFYLDKTSCMQAEKRI